MLRLLFLLTEYLRYPDDAPSEDLRRDYCGQAVYHVFRSDEGLQDVGSEGSYEKSHDVDDYDDSRREFYLEAHLHADDKGQGHGQHREQQLVVNTGHSATQCHDCMENCEYMYDPR